MDAAGSDDAALMQRYAAGDARAFELLYARHRPALWRYVQRHAGADAAADVFQEAWLRVIAHRAQYVPSAPFATWLYRIAHNCCMDRWRAHGRRAQRENSGDEDALARAGDDGPGPERLAMELEDAARLQQALALLPGEQRSAFLLYVEAGLDVAAIGAATGVGAETAKSRLRYAVAKLKSLLGEAGSDAGGPG